MTQAAPRIYNIPAGRPFARDLAAGLLRDAKDNPERLADTLILLPTRRATRVLQDAFLQESDGKALILPRIQPIGDIDEEELSLSMFAQGTAFSDIPPAIDKLERQILLAKLVQKKQERTSAPVTFDNALAMAAALGHLMDQINTEDLDPANLKNIAPENLQQHWQINLEFLEIISHAWPEILKEKNVIDPADRRNRLLLKLGQFWLNNPPQYPIIAAGTTGSIPAVAKLLGVISRLTYGSVILPGLDSGMDDESWEALDETHPQYGFKLLLGTIDADAPVPRSAVKPWKISAAEAHNTLQSRLWLAREIMRPAETSQNWISLSGDEKAREFVTTALQNLHVYECEDERQEAQTIALVLRETLETKGKTAALITPDRNLARRVSAALQRWNINIDDSAGLPLNKTPAGVFAHLCLKAVIDDFAPVSLLALMKHPLFGIAEAAQISTLDVYILRGQKPKPGFKELYERLSELQKKGIKTEDSERFLSALESYTRALSDLREKEQAFETWLKAHIHFMEALSGEPSTLWQSDDGEALASFFTQILAHADAFPEMSLQSYADTLDGLMSRQTIRTKYGTHPRLFILGQLEARLLGVDRVVLGGLNEGTWPPDPGHDPWMSHPMRKSFGLPTHERGTGLSAHDFTQGFCAPEVFITRSLRRDGAPTVPARWIQRLETVVKAINIGRPLSGIAAHRTWTTLLDQQKDFVHIAPPAPTPPVEKRPQKLNATDIEKWMQDPYYIYARYILGLRKLDPLEKPADAALRGQIIHRVLENFTNTHRDSLPANIPDALLRLLESELKDIETQDADWDFWRMKFTRISTAFAEKEKTWRNQGAQPLKTEAEGEMNIGGMRIKARADRIDITPHGLAIIDYKSGDNIKAEDIPSGRKPQLCINGLIAVNGQFSDVAARPVSCLSYWQLSGSYSKSANFIEQNEDIQELLDKTREGLLRYISLFSRPETPYLAVPNPENAPRFNDYEHLERVKEWSVQDDQEAA